MTKVCGRCETENTDAAKVCKLCGTPFSRPEGAGGLLRSGGVQPPQPPQPPHPPAPPSIDETGEATVMMRVPPRPAVDATPLRSPPMQAAPPPVGVAPMAAASGGSLLDVLGQTAAATPPLGGDPLSAAAVPPLSAPPSTPSSTTFDPAPGQATAGAAELDHSDGASRKLIWIGMALVLLLVVGGGYWWTQNDATVVATPAPAATSDVLATQPEPAVPAPTTQEPAAAIAETAPIIPLPSAPDTLGTTAAQGVNPARAPVPMPAPVQSPPPPPVVAAPAPRPEPAVTPKPVQRPAPAPRPTYSNAPAAPVDQPKPAPSGPVNSPQEACASKSFLARPFCMHEQCSSPRFQSHPQCVKLREDQQRGGG